MAAKKQKSLLVTEVIVYRDDAGEWRWSARAGNGRVVSDSAEGYRNRLYAAKMARRLFPEGELVWASR